MPTSIALGRRAALLAFAGLALAGCDDEPAQRKAFITFLQTRIVDKPGVHVARPTEDEKKSWGDYASHYAIITGFNDTLSERVSRPMQAAMQRGNITSLAQVIERKADLASVQRGLADMAGELDRQLAAADAAKAALKQPADLVPVFNAAYDRNVTGPAKAFKDIFPVLKESLDAILSLADYLEQNRAKVKIEGAMIQTADPALQREIQARLAAVNAKAQSIQAAQQRLRSVIAGS